MNQRPYSLIALELEDVVPRRDSSKPNIYISITTMTLDARFGSLNDGRGPGWLSGNIRLIRHDLSCTHFTHEMECAKTSKSELIETLRSEGYTVNRNTDIWTVYVIELDPMAIKDSGLGYVYVGETKKNPTQRFEEHLSRAVNNKTRLFSPVVAKHGQSLRMDLAPEIKYFDKISSKHAEAEWASHLRSLGYVVEGGH